MKYTLKIEVDALERSFSGSFKLNGESTTMDAVRRARAAVNGYAKSLFEETGSRYRIKYSVTGEDGKEVISYGSYKIPRDMVVFLGLTRGE